MHDYHGGKKKRWSRDLQQCSRVQAFELEGLEVYSIPLSSWKADEAQPTLTGCRSIMWRIGEGAYSRSQVCIFGLIGLLQSMSRVPESHDISDAASRNLFKREHRLREASGLMSCNDLTGSSARSYDLSGSTVQKDAILRPRQKLPAHHVPDARGRRGGTGGCVGGGLS